MAPAGFWSHGIENVPLPHMGQVIPQPYPQPGLFYGPMGALSPEPPAAYQSTYSHQPGVQHPTPLYHGVAQRDRQQWAWQQSMGPPHVGPSNWQQSASISQPQTMAPPYVGVSNWQQSTSISQPQPMPQRQLMAPPHAGPSNWQQFTSMSQPQPMTQPQFMASPLQAPGGPQQQSAPNAPSALLPPNWPGPFYDNNNNNNNNNGFGPGPFPPYWG
ncbi:hypothetical protein F4779DRAFT_643257 [Xylariaceae sp. FL0662B]|nr:hypothetical protein F4779DRAFT_643257 [Xylariaceae sp. FL0662B]